jgi:hypothetical protein
MCHLKTEFNISNIRGTQIDKPTADEGYVCGYKLKVFWNVLGKMSESERQRKKRGMQKII